MDGDCSQEIKRYLLLRRKAITNLDSALKNKDTTLLTKVHIVKAMVFPVIMFGCESWTIKKAKHQRIDAFELVLEKTCESLLGSKESNQSVLKEINLEYFLEGLMLVLKLQYFVHLMGRANLMKNILMLGKIEGRRRRG